MGGASERQVEANRRNAERSTGPRTPSGKARSRANGLRHGLAAEVLVPEGDRAAYEATLARWEHQAGPDNVAEHHLIRRAAIASVTLDRLDEAREETRQEAARDAVRRWERTKQHAARRKAQELAKDPGGTVADLEGTAFGCDWLIRRWEALDGPLAAGMAWTRAQLGTAQRLLGYPDGRPGIDAERPIRVLWLLAGALAPFSIGTLPRTTAEAPMPTDPGPARAQLRRFVAAQVDRLEELRAEAWEAVEGPECRAVVIRAAAADTTEEGRLRHRYATDADRSHNAAMRLFYRARGLRRQEYLAIAKEGRQSGKLPRVPVGGGWWREVDSDPAPPGYARVDPVVAEPSNAAGPMPWAGPVPAPALVPMPDPADVPTGLPEAADRPARPEAPASAASRWSEPDFPADAPGDYGRNPNPDPPFRGDTPAGPIGVRWRTGPLPDATAGPAPLAVAAGPSPDAAPAPAPTAAEAQIAPADAGDRPAPGTATGLGAPRRSEPNLAAQDAGDRERNSNADQPLRSGCPADPINVPWRTGTLPSPPDGTGLPAAGDGPGGASRPLDRRPGPPDPSRRSEPNDAAGIPGDPRRNPIAENDLRNEEGVRLIGGGWRTQPSPSPARPGRLPSDRPG